ncbi:MAG TPA: hypothetical protein DIW61_15960 [Candidatus Aminicenantes bacterium]|nr:hypothetical protein [Candidatus Aminicenantes bacterium]
MITTAEEFVRLRESDKPDEYQRAAHEAAPVEVWHDVISRYPHMRAWVAHNKTVPIRVLEILANDSDPDVRAMVAMKRKLTPELQLLLAADPDKGVRGRLANNAKVTTEVLKKIADGASGPAAEDAARRLGHR